MVRGAAGPLDYEIVEISTHEETGSLYVLVDFGTVKEEFLMQIPATRTRIITDQDGNWQRADGTFVPPPEFGDPKEEWARETVPVDAKAVILANLARFAAAHVVNGEFNGDLTAKGLQAIKRNQSDPHGHLAKPGIQALVTKATPT